jgi:hypothetical protein
MELDILGLLKRAQYEAWRHQPDSDECPICALDELIERWERATIVQGYVDRGAHLGGVWLRHTLHQTGNENARPATLIVEADDND